MYTTINRVFTITFTLVLIGGVLAAMDPKPHGKGVLRATDRRSTYRIAAEIVHQDGSSDGQTILNRMRARTASINAAKIFTLVVRDGEIKISGSLARYSELLVRIAAEESSDSRNVKVDLSESGMTLVRLKRIIRYLVAIDNFYRRKLPNDLELPVDAINREMKEAFVRMKQIAKDENLSLEELLKVNPRIKEVEACVEKLVEYEVAANLVQVFKNDPHVFLLSNSDFEYILKDAFNLGMPELFGSWLRFALIIIGEQAKQLVANCVIL